MKNYYDWKLIQKRYDEGLSFRDLRKEFGVVPSSLGKAIKRGDFISRDKSSALKIRLKRFPLTLSEKTKDKISKARLKYLEENPDKVPYLLNHSSKKSYPEEVFEKALISNGIEGFKYNYQNGIYQYDFAFLEKKIDVEIDGGTHLTDKVKKIDERRDKCSKEQGWTVVRFTAKEVKKDVNLCIEKLKKLL